jgi:hypothetical protein
MTKVLFGTAITVGALLAGSGGVAKLSNCCYPGSECCYPGSPCCEATVEMLACTTAKAECCAVKETCCATQDACCPANFDCCVEGANCCYPGSPCCEAAAAQKCTLVKKAKSSCCGDASHCETGEVSSK